MSGCGCNKESAFEETEQKLKTSQQDACKALGSVSEKNNSSCCGSDTEQELADKEKGACDSSKPCSSETNSHCGSVSKTNAGIADENANKVTFISEYHIPKMDCSAEEQMVRMTLSSLTNIDMLIFDLPNRSLKVRHSGEANEITAKLENLGFGAKLNKSEILESQPSAKEVSTYSIPKMDCSAEEQMVRMTLSPLQQVKGLTFDLSQRKLKVYHANGINEITAKLESLGFGAVLIETVRTTEDLPETPDPVQQTKVLKLLLAINGVLFFIEFISGIIAASTGLIADSLDMFADAAVYGIALYAVGKAARYQVKAAHLAGWIQLILASIVIVDVVRRFMFGSEPESNIMIIIALCALIANAACLYLLAGHKNGGAHMKASWIFTANDVIVNMGVILAGILVAWTGSAYPDLIIGILVSLFVLNGARKILALK
ncbi:cation transporter [Acinetobacter nosocomialis]|uniref:cation transporter n=1 Tax=Acinetobacter nosocomialis TaxID=106654 RepID=UPI0026EACD6B|nr:cation transporter [Acinetobacter nosocomialis]MDO7231309.1 cation transporter [Acinetobacter nosocomialis]